MATAQRPTIRERAERICNVALSLPWCQPRLGRRRTRPCKKIRAQRKVPEASETVGEHLALVVSTLATARRRQRNGDDAGALALDVEGESQRRHAARHRGAQRVPAIVLEGMHDRLGGAAGECVRRPCRAHVGRQERAPDTRCRRPREVARMTAAIAARSWKLLCPEPAGAAHQLALVRRARVAADGAGGREEQIEQRATTTLQRRDQRSALHIALRSGSMPNQRSNDRAPCSTSIPSPSAARCPASRAARTQRVSPVR